MVAVVEQIYSAGALLQQKGEQRRVGLGGVAGDASQDQVVRPIVRGLAAAGTDVVESDDIGRGGSAAIRAHRTVELKEPLAMRLKGPPGRPLKRSSRDLRVTLSGRSSTHKNPYRSYT